MKTFTEEEFVEKGLKNDIWSSEKEKEEILKKRKIEFQVKTNFFVKQFKNNAWLKILYHYLQKVGGENG